jgi:hypothetical protein
VRVVHSAALALVAGVLACRSAEPFGLNGGGQLTAQGLEQTVQLIPAQPVSGQEVQIVSVVTNRSSGPVPVDSRICGLDITGNVALVVNYMRCAGYSQSVVLASGDSVTGSDMRVVSSPPGQYTVRVRQLIQPEAWVEVPVVVR